MSSRAEACNRSQDGEGEGEEGNEGGWGQGGGEEEDTRGGMSGWDGRGVG